MPLIHPDSRSKEFWDLFVLFLTIVASIVVPLQIALHTPFHSGLFLYESALSIFFGADILLHFNTSLRVDNRIITDRKQIAIHYLRTWFLPDLLAALPFFVLHQSDAIEAARVIRGLRIMQVNRLLKLARISSFFQELHRKHAINPGLFRLGYFLLLMALATHILACGWILLDGIPHSDDSEHTTVYIKALYYTVTTVATVGYGDIVPINNIQRVYAMALMMIGVASYSFVIGNLASFLANRDIVRANYLKKLEQVTAFLRYRAIAPELRQKVFSYYSHLWESRMGQDEALILGDLPESLREELALAMRRDLIQKVPFFRDADEDLLRDIVMALRPIVYIPGSYVIREGEVGDCMYIISSGAVEVVSQDGRRVFTVLPEGSFVGEMALIFQTERTASVRARGYCDLYVLTKRSFDFILTRHKDFAVHMREIAETRRKESLQRDSNG